MHTILHILHSSYISYIGAAWCLGVNVLDGHLQRNAILVADAGGLAIFEGRFRRGEYKNLVGGAFGRFEAQWSAR